MDHRPVALTALVKQFVKRVHAHYPDAQLFLFGSRARGDFLKESDWDFMIISDEFKETDFIDRMTGVLRKTKARFALEILCYTPDEFEKKKKQIGTVQSAMKDALAL